MVESFSVTSLKMKRIPLTCGPGMAVTQREERWRCGLRLRTAGPAHYATRGRKKN
jgi:ribosomal protein S27AE